ncbi:AN1-type zinc finger protein 1-like [Schistocerca serialis cubense]|uniref:AN1-type zinc finger protein 1-like n=1 Tax=Schistocerca serialis cubense TaxID=2023355 RepID=UPI00214E0D7F|nr:AN1-type zinc finger protein 1-like [Schistocerca serialis cubense]XP_049956253.1 AN1-type zinc finger protein 1-like [Schistocerca serialis cubense]
MELPHVGKQCAHTDCKQLDFLPFQCEHCKQIFCNDHYLPDRHNCTEQRGTEISAVPVISYKCSICGNSSAVQMNCPVCCQHFCLQHRHHGCLDDDDGKLRQRDVNICKKQYEMAKQEADIQVERRLSLAKKKNNKTAFKVQLMKLKNKAVGNKGIPAADRVYFMIFPPLTLSKQSVPVFVSRHWTVGRAIDSISDLCGVLNRNNDATAPKLRLFHYEGGQLLCMQVDKKLNDLIQENDLVDGESLILEYVDDVSDPHKHLENTKHYKVSYGLEK